MKKYYVVLRSNCAEHSTENLTPADPVEITITDVCPKEGNGYKYLWEIEAENYNEALKAIKFSKCQNGERKYL